MLRSDASGLKLNNENVDNFINRTDFINTDTISEIEKELQEDPVDLISLVFLLYDVPDTALQKLIVYQRVSKDSRSTNLNLLTEWFRYAKSKSSWKHEFLEALIICQMYGIVKKLGFYVPTLQKYYQPDNLSSYMYINPMKKALYKVCENMNGDNLTALKMALLTYNIDTTEYDACEMVFLELLCQKFITMKQFENNKKSSIFEFQVENLATILENFADIRKLAKNLRLLQNENTTQEPDSSTLSKTTSHIQQTVVDNNQQKDKNQFHELFQLFEQLNSEDIEDIEDEDNDSNRDETNFKSDSKSLCKNAYKIKDPKRVGICLIINQDKFYPSKKSIENGHNGKLDNRLGSDKDEEMLKRTMSELKFKVISKSNLDHKATFDLIKKVVKDEVTDNDSMFILCILSHGVRGHVFAADSVKINIEDIENYFDTQEAVKLHGLPKVFIIQACQVDDTAKSTDLVADAGISSYFLKKCDFLIYWATAPEYEAFRHEEKGSFFIQILCNIIKRSAKNDHLYDIFTEVTNKVVSVCEKLKKAQVPIFKSTLRNKLYLQVPK